VALYVILREILFKLITQLVVAWNCTALCISTIHTLQKIFTFLQNKNEITQTGHFIHTQAMFTKFSHQFDF